MIKYDKLKEELKTSLDENSVLTKQQILDFVEDCENRLEYTVQTDTYYAVDFFSWSDIFDNIIKVLYEKSKYTVTSFLKALSLR